MDKAHTMNIRLCDKCFGTGMTRLLDGHLPFELLRPIDNRVQLSGGRVRLIGLNHNEMSAVWSDVVLNSIDIHEVSLEHDLWLLCGKLRRDLYSRRHPLRPITKEELATTFCPTRLLPAIN